MKIGVPKEIKPQEHRIGLTPESVKTLISEGHEVLVENNGGFEAGFENDQYTSVGAKIVDKAEDIFNDADIIVKVKEPQAGEVKMIRENQIVYTYLHLAAAKEIVAKVSGSAINVDEGLRQISAPVTTGSKALIEAAKLLDEKGIHPLDIGLKRPSLDDVFLSLTGHVAEEKTEEVVDPKAKRGGR